MALLGHGVTITPFCAQISDLCVLCALVPLKIWLLLRRLVLFHDWLLKSVYRCIVWVRVVHTKNGVNRNGIGD